jgi:hypothetical protein
MRARSQLAENAQGAEQSVQDQGGHARMVSTDLLLGNERAACNIPDAPHICASNIPGY